MVVKPAQALNVSLKVNNNTIPLFWEARAQVCWEVHLHLCRPQGSKSKLQHVLKIIISCQS